MSNRLILPQHGLITPGSANPTMDLDREPIGHSCPMCKLHTVILLPKGPGQMVWRCPCGMENNLTWQKAPVVSKPGRGAIQLKRRPMCHECQSCGVVDWIALPEGGGEIRWECQCGSVWLIRFTPERWMLAQLKKNDTSTAKENDGAN